jgi:hypothetical protein
MTIKISGWKRIGIIASVVWMLGAGFYTLKIAGDNDARFAGDIYRQCREIYEEGRQTQSEYCAGRGERVPMIDSSTVFNKCMEDYEAQHPDTCSTRMDDYIEHTLKGEWIWAGVVAVVPVPLAWGFTYLILFLVRWVKRGFTV